jgi:hypothetical protein
VVYQCMYCGEFTHTYTEVCRFCSAECMVMMLDEDRDEYGEKRKIYEDCRLKSCYW